MLTLNPEASTAMVDRLKEDDLREYVLEDLTEIYTDLQHDSPLNIRRSSTNCYPRTSDHA